jgi:hypothetical protein
MLILLDLTDNECPLAEKLVWCIAVALGCVGHKVGNMCLGCRRERGGCGKYMYGASTVHGAVGSLFVLTSLLGRPFCLGIALASNLHARLALRGSYCWGEGGSGERVRVGDVGGGGVDGDSGLCVLCGGSRSMYVTGCSMYVTGWWTHLIWC